MTVAELLRLIEPEAVGVDRFVAREAASALDHVFGGQVLAQALGAAQQSVAEERPVHALHALFVRAGDADARFDLEVERVRDGRSYSVRQVAVRQHERTILTLGASFQVRERGREHQVAVAPDTPPPEDLPTLAECLDEIRREHPDWLEPWMNTDRPVEQRFADPYFAIPDKREPLQRIWVRVRGLPEAEGAGLHERLFCYVSDMSLLDTVKLAHGGRHPDSVITSLDHALWYHRPFRMDEWLLYVQDSPVSAGGRGMARGQLFTRGGALVASVAQEGVLRERRPS